MAVEQGIEARGLVREFKNVHAVQGIGLTVAPGEIYGFLGPLLEAVRGRAVGREVYERVSAVGIALVLMLFFIGLSNDVGRLGGG